MPHIPIPEAHRELIAAAEAGTIDVLTVPEKAIGLLTNLEPFARLWNAANSDQTAKLSAEDVAAGFDTPLAHFLLANFIIPYPAAELILTHARRAILMQTLKSPERVPTDSLRRFIAALAQQCFLNEYAMWEEPDESMWAEVLAGNVEAMAEENEPATGFCSAVLGCYRALVPRSPAQDAILANDAEFHDMRVRLVDEPQREAELMGSLPILTTIADATSVSVAAQYEENPYPRWRLAPLPPTLPSAKAIQRLFPFADMTQFGAVDTPRILVAGCGTGYQTAALAKLFEHADITGVDLSRRSLAYATRQAEARGLRATFAQGDILTLDSARLQFDIIACGGVLHHTVDPQRSWAILCKCLRPGGLMEVALYNRHARDWLDAPRRFARNGGYARSPKELRRFRRDILRSAREARGLPAGLNETLNRPDFYSLSMCRDAFFHVQEREYSLRELLPMVEDLGLTFLGLHLPSERRRQIYVTRFPDDPAVRHLAFIEAQEAVQKDFAGPMYTLLLQKPHG